MKLLSKILLLMLLFTMMLSGCQDPFKKPQQPAVSPEEVRIDPVLAQQAKEIAKSVKGVEESTCVVINDEIATGIKVTGFDRWRLKDIEAEVNKKIKEQFPHHEVHVTSDKKLFWQLQQMENEIKDRGVESLPELQNRFDKINQNMGG